MYPLITAATAAALASPIIGAGPHAKAIRVLSPGTLMPTASSPAFPRTTDQVELSPDGTRFATASFHRGRHFRSYLSIYDRSTGKYVGRMRISLTNRVLAWLTPDRIAVIKAGTPTTVRIVSVSALKVVHREVVGARLSGTAKLGEREAVLTAVREGDQQQLRVFGADGTLERTVDLPGMVDGSLHGRSPTGKALVLERGGPLAYEVDVGTGEVTSHQLDLPQGTHHWLEPTAGDMLAVQTVKASDVVDILDPVSFATVKRIRVRGLLQGAGPGFVTFDTEGDLPITVYGAEGTRLWRRRHLAVLDLATFGSRLYAGSGYHDAQLRIFDLATGELRKTLKGRAFLFEVSFGRSVVPRFSSDAINED